MTIPAQTEIGAVRLAVADAGQVAEFYERAIGLRRLEGAGEAVALGADGRAIVELVEEPGAPPRPAGTTGLFHLAILVPDRAELARSLRRVTAAGGRFSGASDHLVSEALYLSDPEGNGIEIYADRPRAEWPRSDGEIRMETLPLDLRGLLEEAGGDDDPSQGMAPGTRIGHVHLNVAELAEAEALYAGALGFDVTVRGYPGALFLSAGGYHHHVGLNTWAGPGAQPPPAGARGLRHFEIVLPEASDLEAVRERLAETGVEASGDGDGISLSDPSRNGIRLVARDGG